jgi:hypothetical protein
MATASATWGDSAVLFDDQTELIQLIPCDGEVLLPFDASRVTIASEVNEIGNYFDVIEYLGTQNLDICSLIISKAPHIDDSAVEMCVPI